MSRIGIDVGGTNTDAALIDGGRVIATVKTPTTADVTSGVQNALAKIIEATAGQARSASLVIIGTTHFVNAVVERQRLNRVAAVRLCLPCTTALTPGCDWPDDLREKVLDAHHLLPGGFELDGREVSPLDEAATRAVARRIADSGVRSVAVTAIFSPVSNTHEARAREWLLDECPDMMVTLSSDIGRLGLLERENVALLNASLTDLARATTRAFRDAMAASGLSARLLLTQNDGTVISAETAERLPVLCISSGPTNSMRGAAFLSGIENAAVVDVGGTTSDIGMLKNGFPRESNTVVEIGGVRTLFRIPDVLSLPLGGGSIVRGHPRRLGPDSVGFRLLQQARVFGGDTLTATDVAVRAGWAAIGNASRVKGVDAEAVRWFEAEVRRMLEQGIDRMKTQAGDVKLLAVGGGAFLVPQQLAGVSEVVGFAHADAANAVGAALSKVSGDVDQVFAGLPRDEAIARATELARERALAAGGTPETLAVVEMEDLPMPYMPADTRRIRVRVAAELGGL